MAAKYWYVAGNGSAAWSVATNWYNATGGTGGTAGVPTVIDDAIVDENSGSGTLTIGGTSTCNSLTTELFTGTLAGASALTINTTDISINGGTAFYLGINSTYTGTITFNSLIDLNIFMSTFHKGGMTFNSAGGVGSWYGDLTITGTLTLTAGTIFGTNAYIGTLSTSNTNVRTFQYDNLYLSGSGTLITGTTQTNLEFTVTNLYLTNTTTSSKVLSLTLIVSVFYIFLEGSGASATTISSGATAAIIPTVYISKTGGTIAFGTSTFYGIEFIEGTTIAWLGISTVTLLGNLILCDSMSITTSNPLTLGLSCTIITFNKVFTSTLTINDTALGGGSSSIEVYGDYVSTTISATAISIVSAAGVIFHNKVTVGTAISVNTPSSTTVVTFNQLVSALSMTFSNIYFAEILSGANITNALTLSLGYLVGRNVLNLGSFVCSGTSAKVLELQDCTVNLTGTGTIWNTSSNANLTYNFTNLVVNVTNTSDTAVLFTAGSLPFHTLKFDRGNSIGSCTIAGSNSFINFIDIGTAAHSLIFTTGTTQTIGHFAVNGNALGIITLNSTTTTTFSLQKSPSGLVNCDYLNINHCIALPSTGTWYAGTNSINNQAIAAIGSGWIFSNMPPRKLGAGGVG